MKISVLAFLVLVNEKKKKKEERKKKKLLCTDWKAPILKMKGVLDMIPPMPGTKEIVKIPNYHI